MEEVTLNANTVFEQPWWLDVVAKGEWAVATIEENDKVIARWPYVLKKNLFFSQIKMPKLTQTLGIWIKPNKGKANEDLSFQKDIIEKLLAKIPSTSSFLITLDSGFKYFLPLSWKGFTIKPMITYKITDLTNLDDIYSNFNKTAKKNINSSKNKVTIKEETDIQVLVDMLDKTFKLQKRKSPIDPKLISEIDKACKKHNAGKFLTAIDNQGNIHACSYFIYDQNTFYYLLSASNPEYRTSGAQSLILWEAIKFAAGVSKEFDFEGSMIEGIEKFFRQFGARPVVYYQISKSNLVFEILELIKPRIKKMIGYK